MSEQQSPKPPMLCKMGCGFFGSDATANCCSKCWMESLKKCTEVPSTTPASASRPMKAVEEPMEICEEIKPVAETVTPAAAPPAVVVVAAAATATTLTGLKKKKSKTSYKSLMAGMLSTQNAAHKSEMEREALTKGLGGGAFIKVEKI